MAHTTNQSEVLEGVSPYRKEFERFEKRITQSAWMLPLRRAGMASFAQQGFPTMQDEDWRFTNVTPISALPFKPAFESMANGSLRELLGETAFAKLTGHRLVFVNGRYAAELSSSGAPIPQGVRVQNLGKAVDTDAAFVQTHLGRYALLPGNAFAALNQAFFLDGAFVHVPAGVTVAGPIQIIHITSAKQAGDTVHPRNLIVAEANSRLTVIESYLSTSNDAYFTNAVTELVVGDNASVEHLKVQDEAAEAFHIATIHGQFGRTSSANVHSFALGARLSRNNIRAQLAGEGGACVLNGLYLTRDEQLADHHMIVEHAQPHCTSHEYFNGILDDKSKGVFHGRILVQRVAQKTDAKQTNKNLLLSDNATADTKPQLEIYADDVKCTHGATVGQLNKESIFYLRSRGIGTDTARRMLIHAFAGEIIERIDCEAAREELDKIVWERLEQNPHLARRK
jgi:Fe-S cluster assembly protein SufD